MGKDRHIKTLYERFSHHKVENLNEFKKNIKKELTEYFKAQEQKERRHGIDANTDVFKAIQDLNIRYSGKFYISNYRNSETKFYSDAEVFRDIWEKIIPDIKLKGREDKMIEVQVLASDFKDAVLLVYKDRDTWNKFNIHIIRDKHSEVLLEGNIAYIMNN